MIALGLALPARAATPPAQCPHAGEPTAIYARVKHRAPPGSAVGTSAVDGWVDLAVHGLASDALAVCEALLELELHRADLGPATVTEARGCQRDNLPQLANQPPKSSYLTTRRHLSGPELLLPGIGDSCALTDSGPTVDRVDTLRFERPEACERVRAAEAAGRARAVVDVQASEGSWLSGQLADLRAQLTRAEAARRDFDGEHELAQLPLERRIALARQKYVEAVRQHAKARANRLTREQMELFRLDLQRRRLENDVTRLRQLADLVAQRLAAPPTAAPEGDEPLRCSATIPPALPR